MHTSIPHKSERTCETCGCDISHRGERATTCGATCRKRLSRRRRHERERAEVEALPSRISPAEIKAEETFDLFDALVISNGTDLTRRQGWVIA